MKIFLYIKSWLTITFGYQMAPSSVHLSLGRHMMNRAPCLKNLFLRQMHINHIDRFSVNKYKLFLKCHVISSIILVLRYFSRWK